MVTAMTRGVGLIPSTAHLCFIRSNLSFTVSNNSYRVGIVGATGAVGQELIALLQAHAFPLAELRPLASARSAGKSIDFGGKKITVQEANSWAERLREKCRVFIEPHSRATSAPPSVGATIARSLDAQSSSTVEKVATCRNPTRE